MKRRLLCIALALLTLLTLSVLALAEDVPEIEIEWLEFEGMPYWYVPETDLFVVRNSDGKYGMAERSTGKTVVPCEYHSFAQYSDGIAAVTKIDENGIAKYGFVDTSGQLVISIQYEVPDSLWTEFYFHEGLAMIAKTENGITKYGFIDTTGQVVIPVEYDAASNFSEGLAPVEQAGVWSYIDHSGETVLSLSASYAHSFSEGVAFIRDGAHSIINTSGEVIGTLNPDAQSYYGGTFRYGLMAATAANGKVGCFDIHGDWVIPAEYDSLYLSDDTLIRAKVDEKSGYIDLDGTVVIPFEYDAIYAGFEGGLSVVANKDSAGVYKWGIINKENQIIIPLGYDSVENLGRYCAVALDGKYGLFESPYYVSDEPVAEEAEAVPEEILEEAPAEELPSEDPAEEIPAEEPIPEPESQPVEPEPVAEEAETSYLLPALLAVGLVIVGVLVFVLLKKKKAAK